MRGTRRFLRQSSGSPCSVHEVGGSAMRNIAYLNVLYNNVSWESRRARCSLRASHPPKGAPRRPARCRAPAAGSHRARAAATAARHPPRAARAPRSPRSGAASIPPPPPCGPPSRQAVPRAAWRDEACPVSTGGGTRRVHSVREGGGGGAKQSREQPAVSRVRSCRGSPHTGRRRWAQVGRGVPPAPSLPYKVDTSRPSLRTNWTRLVHPSVLTGHVSGGGAHVRVGRAELGDGGRHCGVALRRRGEPRSQLLQRGLHPGPRRAERRAAARCQRRARTLPHGRARRARRARYRAPAALTAREQDPRQVRRRRARAAVSRGARRQLPTWTRRVPLAPGEGRDVPG
jgi:hypothetical protein